jgi:hypothetical protein
MLTGKRMAYACTLLTLCSLFLWGCSEDQGKGPDKKTATTQEQMGKEAAQHLQQPIEAAHQAAQTLNDAARDTKQHTLEKEAADTQAVGKKKRQLEGC